MIKADTDMIKCDTYTINTDTSMISYADADMISAHTELIKAGTDMIKNRLFGILTYQGQLLHISLLPPFIADCRSSDTT